MHDLQLVGFTTDRRGLIFRTQAGARVESYVVPITDDLVRLVGQLAESTVDDDPPAVPDEVVEPVVAVAERRAESQLSVRDIQARLRAGEPIARVAAEAGVADDWIERFAPPIRAEQRRVVERAQQSHLQRSRAGVSAVPLRRAVGMAMADKGIAFTVAAFEAAWSARLLGHDRWAVEFTYRHRGQDRTATWDFDAASDSLSTNDRAASQIGFVGHDRSPDDDTGIEVDGIIGAPDAKTQIGTATARGRAAPPVAAAATAGRAPEPAASTAARPRSATRVADKTVAPATKKASKKQAAPAKEAASTKQVAKKARTKKQAAKKTRAKKQTAKKTRTKKQVAKKTPAKTQMAKKQTAEKTPTKKQAAKKTRAKRQATKKQATEKQATEKPSTEKPSTRATPATRRATGSANALIAKTARKQAAPTSEAPPAAVRSAAASKRTVADTKRPIDEVVAPPAAPERTAPPTSNGARTPLPPAAPASVTPASTPEPQSPEALDRLRAQRVADRLAEEGGAAAPPEPPPTSPTPPTTPADADRTAARRARAAERSAPTVQFRSGSAAPVRVVGATEPSSTPARRPADPAPTAGGPNGRPSVPVPGARADVPSDAAPPADANGAARPRTRRRRQLRAR